MKIIVFDMWGDLAHFRIPYTTSSPMTFPVPPKTAIYGIIGAILGYDKNDYLKEFQDKKWIIGISIKNQITKTYIPENFINTKEVKMFARMPKGKSCRTQINLEFVKNPYYRIYLYSDHQDFDKLKERLIDHKTAYTVTLGLSECIANFKWIGEFESEKKINQHDFISLTSILPLNYIKDKNYINFITEGIKLLKIRMPVEMKPNRELIEISDFLLESTGKSIAVKDVEYFEVDSRNIILF